MLLSITKIAFVLSVGMHPFRKNHILSFLSFVNNASVFNLLIFFLLSVSIVFYTYNMSDFSG